MEEHILTVLYWGFGLNFAIIAIMYNSFNSKIDRLDDKITDVDRRLCRIEGSLTAKECCAIKSDHRKDAI